MLFFANYLNEGVKVLPFNTPADKKAYGITIIFPLLSIHEATYHFSSGYKADMLLQYWIYHWSLHATMEQYDLCDRHFSPCQVWRGTNNILTSGGPSVLVFALRYKNLQLILLAPYVLASIGALSFFLEENGCTFLFVYDALLCVQDSSLCFLYKSILCYFYNILLFCSLFFLDYALCTAYHILLFSLYFPYISSSLVQLTVSYALDSIVFSTHVSFLCCFRSEVDHKLSGILYIATQNHLYLICSCKKNLNLREDISYKWYIALWGYLEVKFRPWYESTFHIITPWDVSASPGQHIITSSVYYKTALQASLQVERK